jgi:hypothetical protein
MHHPGNPPLTALFLVEAQWLCTAAGLPIGRTIAAKSFCLILESSSLR